MAEIVPKLRGELLNNPGNIEHGPQVWSGQTADQPDAKLVKFATPEDGLGAIVKTLDTYQRKGITTIAGAVTRWAPPSENDTASYIADECAHCAASPGSPFMRTLLAFVRGLITHEQGRCIYSDAQIQAVIDKIQGKIMATDTKPTTMASVMAHPTTTKAISGGSAAAFVAMELAKFDLYDMSAGETVALGVVFTILLHRLFPQGLSVE